MNAVHPELEALLYAVSNNFADHTPKLVAADWCFERDPEYKSLEWLLRFLADVELTRFESTGEETQQILFTGSRVYGTPKPESDFDWVILLEDIGHMASLRHRCDEDSHDKRKLDYYGSAGIDTAMRFGPVNLLVTTYYEQMHAWIDGTSNLINDWLNFGKKRTREQAIAEFTKQFKKHHCDRQGRLERKNRPIELNDIRMEGWW